MSDKQGFWTRMFGGSDKKTGDSIREAAGYGSYGAAIDSDEDLWRPLSGDTTRDLNPMTQWRMREIARYLWETTPLGNWLVETPIDFLLAEGVRITAKDDSAQGWLTEFWDDPINRMDITLEDKVRELSLYGEQCWIAFTNEMNGHVRLGYLNPGNINTVVMDPDNPAQPIGIVTGKDKKGIARRYAIIINGDEDVFTDRTKTIRATFDDGECFYFKINSLCGGRRGRSDLLSVADWLDGYEEFMFGESDRAQMLKSFLWDVTLTGADQTEVEQKAKSIATPKAGSVRVHNENEQWEAQAPSLNSTDTSGTARMFRNHILGGRAMPEHWFGGGGDINRATASEMNEPTIKRLKRRQRFIRHMLETVGDYVITRRLAAEDLTVKDDEVDQFKAKVEMPEIVSSDVTKAPTAIQQMAAALNMLIDRGLITDETAIAFIARLAMEMDIEFDQEAELKKAKEQAATRREGDVFTIPPAVASNA